MNFISLTFVFSFPVVVLLYWKSPWKYRELFLLAVSYFFYIKESSWAGGLLLLTTAITYLAGIAVEKGRHRRAWLILAVTVCLGFLIGLKYSVPPVGISFYTFQTMSYTIDVYRGEAPVQNNLISFGAYVSMFPQLIAGPIVRYQDIALELNCRQENLEQFVLGIRLFIIGLGKKVLLANQTGALWTEISAILPQERSILMVWIGILAFSFQIYFDFSGYSDMAVGMGHMLGFRFPDNFRYPYISKSITEFWRRWHISLGTWFKEYVYIPLGGNRNGRLLQVRNILIVWLLTGIWHGANLNFLLWGLYFGILLLLEKFVFKNWLNRLPSWIQHIYACLLVIFGWVLFAFEDMNAGFAYLLQMVGGAGLPFCNERTLFLLCGNLILLLISAVGSTPLPAKAASVLSPDSKTRFQNAGKILEPLFLGLVLFLSVAYLVNATYNPFLYFRF